MTCPTARELAEELADRLGCAVGDWTIELRLEHGQLRRVYRHHTLSASAVDELERPPWPASARSTV